MSPRSIDLISNKMLSVSVYLQNKTGVFTCPGLYGTATGQSDFFASLKLSDGPGVGGKRLYEGVPGEVSFGFNDVERDSRDGV